METESSLFTFFSFQLSPLSKQRNLGTDYLCKLCWYGAFWLIIPNTGLPRALPPLPYPCAPHCHTLCSAAKIPVVSVGTACLTVQSHVGTMRCGGAQAWTEKGKRNQGAEDALCQCCCQRIGLIEVWLHRSAESINLAASLLLSAFHIALTQDRKRDLLLAQYMWSGRCLVLWFVWIDLPNLHKVHSVCCVRERNAKRNCNKVRGIKRWLCHSHTKYAL